MKNQGLTEQTVSEEFDKTFGYTPTGVWSAPGRVNLMGEHTDYNQGFVFPFAINKRTFAAVALRQDSLCRVASSFAPGIQEINLLDISPESVRDWEAYPFGVAWALMNISPQLSEKPGAAHPRNFKGFDIFIASEVPVGAGLSSSAALECSVGVALNELWDLGLNEAALAQAGHLAENQIVGVPSGIMDQTASMLGQEDHGIFLDCRSLEAQAIKLGFVENGLELLIIDTTVAHRHSSGGYSSRRNSCELGATLLGVSSLRDLTVDDLPRASKLLDDETFRRVHHIITENQRVLEVVDALQDRGPGAMAHLMYESHLSMRDNFEISIPELNTAVETALLFGALGARMTGGGFGGAAIALTPLEKVSAVMTAVKNEFEVLGYAQPNIFTVSASFGARRES